MMRRWWRSVNRLWVRLSLAFSAVVLIGVVMIVISISLVVIAARPQTSIIEALNEPGSPKDGLVDYYQDRRSWVGVEQYLMGVEQGYGFLIPTFISLSLVDPAGRVVYEGQEQAVVVLENDVLPVEVAGTVQGYLEVTVSRPQRAVVLGNVQVILLVILVGAAIGILFGIFMARTIAAPLGNLVDAAQDIGAHNLDRRVIIEGTTEVHRLAEAFNDMAARLQKGEHLRRNLVADVAHELRTPLTVLQGNLRAILDDVYPLNKEEIANLYDQTRVLSRLVNDLHELSQAEANQLPLNMRPVNIVTMVQRLVATVDPVADEQDVSIVTDFPEGTPTVIGDQTRLAQVLNNLLSNALAHTPHGGTITISVVEHGEQVCITVSDTGSGIPPEDLPHVFDRFYRADPSRSRNRGGAGLGLAIVRAIVVAHGGEVDVRSAVGEGTTFTVELPVHAPVAEPTL